MKTRILMLLMWLRYLPCEWFHGGHHHHYWSEASKWFFKCDKCGHHFARPRTTSAYTPPK